ncbi:isochorismate synthase, partial [bacterium]|nr:isochorismate synthase [bacterium]
MSAWCRGSTPPAIDLSGSDFTGRFHTLQRRLGGGRERLPLTVSVPVGDVQILAWLRGQPAGRRYYWSSRDGRFELAAAGAALRVEADSADATGLAYDRIDGILAAAADDSLFFVGGQAFDPAGPADALWSGFPALEFTIPATMLCRRGATVSLVLCVAIGAQSREDAVRDELAARLERMVLPRDAAAAVSPGAFVQRVDLPGRNDWEAGVADTLAAVSRGAVEKVVMTRRTRLDFTRAVDPVACLETLARANPQCFAYLIEPRAEAAYLGLSPELLFRLEGGRLETEAIAGTAPADGAQDLLACEKNGREHRIVLDHLVGRLTALCSRVAEPEPRRLLNLRDVAHIAVGLSGELAPDRTLGDVVAALHPTPAVCGTSPAAALATIRRTEPFGRGWYTGIVGAIGRRRVELAVAIRSVLVADRRLTAFAGAGIVAGSVPAQEWQELESKI